MILRHTTPTVNLPSIEKRGRRVPRFSMGKLIVVWLHEPSQTEWAISHCKLRHEIAGVASLTTLEVDVPKSWLRRRHKNVWTCDRVIPPERIIGRVNEEAISPEEINLHKERFANSLAALLPHEKARWIQNLIQELHMNLVAEEG